MFSLLSDAFVVRFSLGTHIGRVSLLAVALVLGGWLGTAGEQEAQAQSPRLTLTSQSPELADNFGRDIVGTDVTGDGVSDVIVGAPADKVNGKDAGRVYFLDGTDGSVVQIVASLNPQNGGGFGTVVDVIGDVNGDNVPDLVVGAPGESAGGTSGAGRVYVVSGAGNTILSTITASSPTLGGAFGISVAGIGDVVGNGVPDVAVGSRQGKVFVYDGDSRALVYTIPPPSAVTTFGEPVAGIQDVGGGSTPDVLVGGADQNGVGHVFAFDGANGSLISSVGGSDGIEDPSGKSSTGFGGEDRLLAGMSSVNGDQTPDILVGAPQTTVNGKGQAGKVHIFDGTDGSKIRTLSSPNPENNGEFGVVSTVSDLTGDGRPEVVVGARFESAGGVNSAGRAYLFNGANGTLTQRMTSPNAESSGNFGESVAGIGDTDGGGESDVLVGAKFETVQGTNTAGRAYLFRGEELVPTASASKSVSSDGRKDFGPTGVDIDVSNGSGSGTVTVEKFTGDPIGTDGISESTVSSYRFVIGSDGVSVGSDTKVRFEVATLGGVSTPSDVTVYTRSPTSEGSFSSVSTSYDGDDEIVATVSGFSEFVMASNNNTLPVELADFQVRVASGDALLRWQTASETNNAGFEVQHLSPANEEWTTLGFVESKTEGGTTNRALSYRFRADTPSSGTHRFRLRQVDLDGTATLTDPVTLRIRMTEALRLSPPAPNPITDAATLSFAVKEGARATIALYDVLGQQVATLYEGRAPAGRPQQLRLSATDLPSGTYVLQLRANGQTRSQRVTVVR